MLNSKNFSYFGIFEKLLINNVFLHKYDIDKVSVFWLIDLARSDQLPISISSNDISVLIKTFHNNRLFELSEFIILMQHAYFNYGQTVREVFGILYFILLYFESDLEFNYLGVLYIIDLLFSENYQSSSIGNLTAHLGILDLFSEMFDYAFLFLVFSFNNYFEFFGQLF